MDDVIFFGKVVSVKRDEPGAAIERLGNSTVTFEVITPYKDAERKKIEIRFDGYYGADGDAPEVVPVGPTGFEPSELYYMFAIKDERGDLQVNCSGTEKVKSEFNEPLPPDTVDKLLNAIEMKARIAAIDKVISSFPLQFFQSEKEEMQQEYFQGYQLKKARIFFDHKDYKNAQIFYEKALVETSGGYDPWYGFDYKGSIIDDSPLQLGIPEDKHKQTCGRYVGNAASSIQTCTRDLLNLATVYLRRYDFKSAQLPVCNLRLYCNPKSALYAEAGHLQAEIDEDLNFRRINHLPSYEVSEQGGK